VIAHPAGLHLLARIDGMPAGACSLFAEAGMGCVYNVGAFPAYRGQGVATTLLRRLAEEAQARGVTTLFLQAVHQGPAQPLYRRMGYVTRLLRGWYLPDAPGGIWS
jgi:GNAT superfamily N-acetyltransferase